MSCSTVKYNINPTHSLTNSGNKEWVTSLMNLVSAYSEKQISTCCHDYSKFKITGVN